MDPNLFERLNCIVLISLMKFDEIVIFFFYDDKTNLVDSEIDEILRVNLKNLKNLSIIFIMKLILYQVLKH